MRRARYPDEEAVAVGWSLGASFGVQLAAQHPARILGLACVAPLVEFLESVRAGTIAARVPVEA